MSHKLAMILRNLPSALSLPSPDDPATQVVVTIQMMMIPLVLAGELLELLCGAVVEPGSAADETIGKGFMMASALIIAFLLSGAFGLR